MLHELQCYRTSWWIDRKGRLQLAEETKRFRAPHQRLIVHMATESVRQDSRDDTRTRFLISGLQMRVLSTERLECTEPERTLLTD